MKANDNFILRCVKLQSLSQFQPYKLRQECVHQAIPIFKLIARNQNILYIQIEVSDKRLIDYIKVLDNQLIILQLLQEVLSAATYIRSKFGCFAVSENHIKIDPQGSPKIWFNEDNGSILRQIPLPNQKSGERAMIKSIMAVFKPSIKKYQGFLKIDNFEELKTELKRLINSQRQDRDIDRRLTHTTNKALSFLKNSKFNNTAAGTSRQNNTFGSQALNLLSPRFSSFEKDKLMNDSWLTQSKKQQKFQNNIRKNLFQMMKIPNCQSKKMLEDIIDPEIRINSDHQTISHKASVKWLNNSNSTLLSINQKKNRGERTHVGQLNLFRKSTQLSLLKQSISNNSLEKQFDNLFDADSDQLECKDNNQLISEEIEKDFNFIFH